MGDDYKTEAERLAAMESELQFVKDYLIRIDTKLDAYAETYVPRTEINEMFRARDEQIRELKEQRQSSHQLWPTWLAAIAAVISCLAAILPHIK
jgi:hypothetical protein